MHSNIASNILYDIHKRNSRILLILFLGIFDVIAQCKVAFTQTIEFPVGRMQLRHSARGAGTHSINK